MPRRSRVLVLAIGLLACAVGCFRAAAYPDFSSCPGTTFTRVPDKIFAIRVEVISELRGPTMQLTSEQHTASWIDVSDGKVPEQRLWSFGYWWATPKKEESTGEAKSRTVMVKLYRRGYQTVVFRPKECVTGIIWVAAKSLDDQAYSIRQFAGAAQHVPKSLAPGSPASSPPTTVSLSPGSAGEQHKQVLLFIASEFDRLAELYVNAPEKQRVCRAEAEAHRQLANR